MVGRLLGGVATSILYSAFESWLVYEHNKVTPLLHMLHVHVLCAYQHDQCTRVTMSKVHFFKIGILEYDKTKLSECNVHDVIQRIVHMLDKAFAPGLSGLNV